MLNHVQRESYTETEAAELLQITIPRLRTLLQRHIFNDGSSRPDEISFTYADLVLLDYWHHREPALKVVARRASV